MSECHRISDIFYFFQSRSVKLSLINGGFPFGTIADKDQRNFYFNIINP